METALGGPEKLAEAINRKEVYSKVIDGVEFFFDRTIIAEKQTGMKEVYDLKDSQAIDVKDYNGVNDILDGLSLNWMSSL